MRLVLIAAGVFVALAAPAQASQPKLTVPKRALNAALHCGPGVDHAARTPIMLVAGTGTTGAEAYAIAKPAFDVYGAPVCYVDFPHFTARRTSSSRTSARDDRSATAVPVSTR